MCGVDCFLVDGLQVRQTELVYGTGQLTEGGGRCVLEVLVDGIALLLEVLGVHHVEEVDEGAAWSAVALCEVPLVAFPEQL